MEDTLLTTADAADELGCSVSTIRRLIDEGELPAKRVGGRWLIAVDDLDDLRDELEAEDEGEGGEDGEDDDEDGDEDEDGDDDDDAQENPADAE